MTLPNQTEECYGLPQAGEAHEFDPSTHDFDPYLGDLPVSGTPSLLFDSLTSTPVNNASQCEGMDIDSLFGLVDFTVKGQSDNESYYAESEGGEGQPEDSGSEDDYDESADSDDDSDDDDSAPSHAYTQFVLPTWQVCVPSTPPPSPQTLLQGQGPPLPPSITIITPPPTAHPAIPPTDHLTSDIHTPDIPCSPKTTTGNTPIITSPPEIELTTALYDPTSPSSTLDDDDNDANDANDEPLRCRRRFRNGLRCTASFTSPIYLARHKRAIHPAPKWAKTCIFCRYRLCFTERDAYVRHLDRVHGMRGV